MNGVSQMSLLATIEGQEAEEEAKRKAVRERVSMVESALRNMGIELDSLAGSIARLIARAVGTGTLVRTKQELADDKAIRDDFNRRKRRRSKDGSIPDGAPDLSSIRKALKFLADKDIIERSVIVPAASMKCEGVGLSLNMKLLIRAANDRLFCRNQISVRDFEEAIDPFPRGTEGRKEPGKEGGTQPGSKGRNTPGKDPGKTDAPIRNTSHTPEPFYPNNHDTLGSGSPETSTEVVVVVDKNFDSVKAVWEKLIQATRPHRRAESGQRLWELAWFSERIGETSLVDDCIRAAKNPDIESLPRYIAGMLRKACEDRRKSWVADMQPLCPSMPPLPAPTKVSSPQRLGETRNDFEKRFREWWKSERIKRNGGPLTEEDLIEESRAAEAAWLRHKQRIDDGGTAA